MIILLQQNERIVNFSRGNKNNKTKPEHELRTISYILGELCL